MSIYGLYELGVGGKVCFETVLNSLFKKIHFQCFHGSFNRDQKGNFGGEINLNYGMFLCGAIRILTWDHTSAGLPWSATISGHVQYIFTHLYQNKLLTGRNWTSGFTIMLLIPDLFAGHGLDLKALLLHSIKADRTQALIANSNKKIMLSSRKETDHHWDSISLLKIVVKPKWMFIYNVTWHFAPS